MSFIVLIRGMPGSGKNFFAKDHMFSDDDCIISADDYFMLDDKYVFDANKLTDAHNNCLSRARHKLQKGFGIIVCNTFSCHWEMYPYIRSAKDLNCSVTVIDLYDGGLTDQELFERNTHNVPLATIQSMRARWEHDWKNGDSRPPFLRRR